jgi:hypothetical protein
MRQVSTRHVLFGLVAGCAVLAASCGGRGERLSETGATLEGTVTYGQQKVMVAMVIVQGAGGAATGYVGDDGRYKIENVPLGEVSIGVNTDAGKGEAIGRAMAQSKGKGPMPKVIDVPTKYHDPNTSGIKTTVQRGSKTFDIVIPK